jgi:hypothetical protein
MSDRLHEPGLLCAEASHRTHLNYGFACLGLLLLQGAITLGLFGPADHWQRLTDDRPVVSGRHPLHLYHGLLGARHWLRDGSFSAYDPAFQAGYPKSPAFDAGCRPAELLFLGIGGRYRPAAYKMGLAVTCLLAPFGFVVCARLLGSGPWAALLAGLIGVGVVWSSPTRTLIDSGDLDVLLAGMAALLHVACLERFHSRPGPGGWCGLIVTSGTSWYLHPLLGVGTVLLALGCWLKHARRHGWDWHVLLALALSVAALVNLEGLSVWSRSWWVCLPSGAQEAHRSVADGTPAIMSPGGVGSATLVALALAGMRLRKSLTAVTVSGVTIAALALAGWAWEPVLRAEAAKLFAVAAWFAVPAAAEACGHGLRLLVLPTGGAVRTALASAVILTAGFFLFQPPAGFSQPDWGPRPLSIGLSDTRQAIIDRLREPTSPVARVLWEDSDHTGDDGGWTVLLPLLTGRPVIGGLDADGRLEHTSIGLRDGWLAGRPLDQWADGELESYCRRYNVGWVVASSRVAAERLSRLTWAERQTSGGTGTVELYRLDRPNSFVLRGQARWLSADSHAVALADVVPENGEVVLSLHYQNGWRVRPGNVRVEREPDAYDPIPFVRLRLPGPVARLTLEWSEP